LSSGANNDSENGKSKLPCLEFNSLFLFNVLNGKNDLGKGVFRCEDLSKGKWGVEGIPDYVDWETEPKKPCGKVVWVESIVEPLEIEKVVEVEGIGSTQGGGIAASTKISFSHTSILVGGG
jgi:hypothetical protein